MSFSDIVNCMLFYGRKTTKPNDMTRKFKITYLTSWGEEIKFVFGEERADMQYLPGGVWKIDIDGSKIKAGTGISL